MKWLLLGFVWVVGLHVFGWFWNNRKGPGE
jgi:hypothetical protein